ncbi:MAG: hypothetical protein ACXVLT_10565 [Flavisolibacter sp.]
MISVRTLCTTLMAASMISFTACNNSQTKTNESTGDTTTATTPANTTATTAPASNIVTSPQNMLVVMQKVANYAKWKPMYDGHDTARVAAGLHNYVIGRGVQDSNAVMVVLKVDDTAKAKAFAKDPGLKKVMQKAGVVGAPTIALITTVYQDTSNVSTTLRASSMLTVKDFDAWVKALNDGDQERRDNGIVVRAYGHDASDNHKVRIVSALTDSTKAMAYYKSDAIKKRMADAGVVGQPIRFFYHVVQHY